MDKFFWNFFDPVCVQLKVNDREKKLLIVSLVIIFFKPTSQHNLTFALMYSQINMWLLRSNKPIILELQCTEYNLYIEKICL